MFGAEARSDAPTPPIDLKSLHAKIGELALENDFLSGVLSKGRRSMSRTCGLSTMISGIERKPANPTFAWIWAAMPMATPSIAHIGGNSC